MEKSHRVRIYDPIISSPIPSRKQYRPKVSVPVITLIVLILGLQFIVLPRYVYQLSPAEEKVSESHLQLLDEKLRQCSDNAAPPIQYPATQAGSRQNPRWNSISGQNEIIVLKNATLFDGETILAEAVDVVLEKGVVDSISPTGTSPTTPGAKIINLNGKYITPGLVDMHSHHMAMAWPLQSSTDDTNEVNDIFGALTPQVRIIDSLKAYDPATEIIASGGVTTSLILPGSANIMGGEAVLVKNVMRSGENAEIVVEDMLLEHGVPTKKRRRFMKMACGENPRRVYKHTRMGNAWLFRKHMERAKELQKKKQSWCLEAAAVKERGLAAEIPRLFDGWPDNNVDYLEYDSTIAMLDGKIGVNVHCYEPEDFEDMLHHSKEFGFRIQAFHHALSAWQVPEMIKASGENITIATFAEFGYFKKEAYEANLWAGKILADHGVPVAYKSDHVTAETSAKYLLYQAATAHSFNLSEALALQSVTSVPAKSLGIDHRVGYIRPGYDADLVIWDSHPLSVGATALQVYIDGKPILDDKKVAESLPHSTLSFAHRAKPPAMRKVLQADVRKKLCEEVEKDGVKLVITGITTSFVDNAPALSVNSNHTMVIVDGEVVCFDTPQNCLSYSSSGTILNLKNGHIAPGLTTISVSLGLSEIAMDGSTSDGSVPRSSASYDVHNVVYAKYGVHLDGKSFARARLGGVMNVITAPISSSFAGGVSVGILTSGKKSILNGGVFEEEVALHFTIGQDAKSNDALSTVSSGIAKLSQILSENVGKDDIYGRAANGSIPVVVHVENEYDIVQIIKIQRSLPTTNIILFGGSGAPLVASELAASKIPIILTSQRGAPDSFEKRNALPGPPLSRSPVEVLSAAGVKFGIALAGEVDSHIHSLATEAGWMGKYAGLGGKESLRLVSGAVEEILGLKKGKGFVIWEGNPLEFGASVVLSVENDGMVGTCWPEST